MSLCRFNRKIKSLAQKGKPGSIARHVVQRSDASGIKRDFHYTKGWRSR